MIIVSQIPSLGNNLSACQSLFPFVQPGEGRCSRLSKRDVQTRVRFTDNTIRAQADDQTLAVTPSEVFCSGPECLLTDPETGELLYKDSNHLSDAGSLFLFQKMAEKYGLMEFLNDAGKNN